MVSHVKNECFSSISETLEIHSVFMQLSGQIGIISDLVSGRSLIHGVTVISKFILCGVWSSHSIVDANSSLVEYL